MQILQEYFNNIHQQKLGCSGDVYNNLKELLKLSLFSETLIKK